MRHSPLGRRFLASVLLAAPLSLAACGLGETLEEPEGERQEVPITLANHTSTVADIWMEDSCEGSCEVAANGGWRIVRPMLRNGSVVEFTVYAGGLKRDEVSCKWRGETTIMVDYQVPEGSQVAQLLCVVWGEP